MPPLPTFIPIPFPIPVPIPVPVNQNQTSPVPGTSKPLSSPVPSVKSELTEPDTEETQEARGERERVVTLSLSHQDSAPPKLSPRAEQSPEDEARRKRRAFIMDQ